ncbi:MAG: hypothetical protein ABI718_17690 [Acidobacteriota bacterium]
MVKSSEAGLASGSDAFEIRADDVPLDGIGQSIEDLVALYGGEIDDVGAKDARFRLPVRRGVAASGQLSCTIQWQGPGSAETGTVRLRSRVAIRPPRLQRLLLLVVGASGAMLWILWPFFPGMGALSWIGGAMAFATYFLTVRQTGGGIFSDFLSRLVAVQNEPMAEE